MENNITHKAKISIITVVFNSERFIENTIKSVISQEYNNIEYIIIDGKSTDGTIDIINRYKSHVDILISEKDEGLYDAMNKAIKLATGDYLWFINSGDEIYSTQSLSKIFASLSNDSKMPDVIYGETEIINQNGETIGMRRHSVPEKLNWKSLRLGMKVCHQSVLVAKNAAGLYDTTYRYSADYEWLIRGLKQSDNIFNSHLILSKFMEGGTTDQNLISGLKERFKIMSKYYGLISTTFINLYLAIRLLFFYIKNKHF